MSLNERVKNLRIKRELSLRELGKKVGLTPQALSHMERHGWLRPKLKTMLALAGALNTTVDYLQYGTVDEKTVKTIPGFVSPNKSVGRVILLNWNELELFKSENFSKIETQILLDPNRSHVPIFDEKFLGCFALPLEGDSMPTWPNAQSYIWFKPFVQPSSGQFVVALIDSVAVFRQYTREGNSEYLKSINPQYPLIPVTPAVSIVGVAVKLDSNLF